MSAPKVLEILQLFTAKAPRWRVEQIADWIGVSPSTAYRCVGELVRSGFLEPVARGTYVLGPAFIEFDRRIRLSDPLLKAATPRMQRLCASVGPSATTLLSRYYRDCVVFVHIECGRDASPGSYDRGQPIRLFSRTPAARAVLAALPDRLLRGLYRQHAEEIAESGLGTTARDFRSAIKSLRVTTWVHGRSTLVPGRFSVAAPIIATGAVVGSLAVSLPDVIGDEDIARVGQQVAREANRIAVTLGREQSEAPRLLGRRAAEPARVQVSLQ